MKFTKIHPEARDILTSDYDPYDAWGWAMSHHFAIAELMYVEDIQIPQEWEFHASPCIQRGELEPWTEEHPDCDWINEWLAGHIDANDLLYVGSILHRYEKVLEKAGRSY